MTLLIAIMIMFGLNMSSAWLLVIIPVWVLHTFYHDR
jgi:hypothetical protein